MADIQIQLPSGKTMEKGKCYTLSGNASTYFGGNILFQIGTKTIADKTIGTVTGLGDFSFDFDYELTDPTYTSLYITGLYNAVVTDLAITLDSDCAVAACSECFNLSDCHNVPLMELEWTNNEDAFNFPYSTVQLSHTLTVAGGLRIPTGEYPVEDYYETSGGSRGIVFAHAKKIQEMWVHDLPEYLHDALRLGVVHDSFTINDKEYVKQEGAYTPDWNVPETLLAPVIIKVQEKVQNTFNDNC